MAKSKLTKAKEISQETKQIVLERQGYRSISGVYIPDIHSCDFHHVIFRSEGGIGAEWNIVAVTFDELRWIHDKCNIKVNGRDRYSYIEFTILMKNHLKRNYLGWSEDRCKFKKYKEFSEYGVTRCFGMK